MLGQGTGVGHRPRAQGVGLTVGLRIIARF